MEEIRLFLQGPPGTGKSYIGVKIVQLLLSMPSRPSGPILVFGKSMAFLTCFRFYYVFVQVLTYKNHALDQFLEDCLPFCSNVVRVGGRSTSDALREKNIHEVSLDRQCYHRPAPRIL